MLRLSPENRCTVKCDCVTMRFGGLSSTPETRLSDATRHQYSKLLKSLHPTAMSKDYFKPDKVSLLLSQNNSLTITPKEATMLLLHSLSFRKVTTV